MAVSAETKVGVFVIIGLALLLAGTLIVEDVNPFRRGYVLKAYFDSVEGLMPGNVVTMAGVECGKVKEMGFVENRVEVVLQIDEGTIVREDSVATVAMQTVLGGKKIALTMGTPDQPALEPGDVMTSEETLSIGDFAAAMAKELTEFFDENAPTLSRVVSNIEEISNDLKEGKGTRGKVLTDEELYNEAVKVIATLSDVGERAQKILDEEGTKLSQIVDDMAEIASQIRDGEGTIGRLLWDDEPYQNILQASQDLKEVIASAKELISGRTEELESFVAAGPKIFEAAEKLQALVTKLDEGTGTRGLLINDPSLYEEAKALIAEIRGAVEDIRGQIPAASLAGLALGVAK